MRATDDYKPVTARQFYSKQSKERASAITAKQQNQEVTEFGKNQA